MATGQVLAAPDHRSPNQDFHVLSTANITVQFGPRPLFENISVKFGGGNHYDLIGANDYDKSTSMKILGDDLESSAGNVMLEPGVRLGKLRQDQFAYEDMHVLDVVMMGHTEMWAAAQEHDTIYANPEATDDDYMKTADLEAKRAEYDGYVAEARAGELLMGVGIPTDRHNGTMSNVAPGWKLHMLLTQALFSNPDVLLLDEPANNLNINTIRWLESMFNKRNSIMIIISRDRHFPNSVCTHMADMDYDTPKVYLGNYDDYMRASLQAREHLQTANTRAREHISDLQSFVHRFSANKSKAHQTTSRLKMIDKIKVEDIRPSLRQNPFVRFETGKKLHNLVVETENAHRTYDCRIFNDLTITMRMGKRIAIIGENGAGKTTLLRCLLNGAAKTGVQRGIETDGDTVKQAENANVDCMPQDTCEEFPEDRGLMDWMNQWMQPDDDDQSLRDIMGRLLFSVGDIKENVRVLSGDEKGCMIWGELMLGRHDVLALDEPINHMDMESIESLQVAFDKFEGTLIFMSHNRELISALATRIIGTRPDGTLAGYLGTYNECLQSQGVRV